MANGEPGGRVAVTPGQEPDDGQVGRAVAAYVESVRVPVGLLEADWRSRRRLRLAWAGASPGTSRRASGLTALAAVAAVSVIAVVIGLAGRQPLPEAASAPAGGTLPPFSASIPSVLLSSLSPAPSSVSPSIQAAPALGGAAWFSMAGFGGCPANSTSEPLSACSGTTKAVPGSLELFAGTLDGRTTLHVTRSLPVSAHLWVGRGSQPDAAGPFDGKVLYNLFDGSRSELHVVDAASGSDETVVTTDNVVYNAVLDPSSGTVFFGQLDPSTRHDLGVWRVRLGGSAQPELFVRAAAHNYGGSWQWSRTLLITPSGSRLLIRDCQDASCDVSVFATGDSHLISSANGLRDDAVFGVTDASLVGILACAGSPCGVSSLDLASGQVRTLTDDPCALSGTGVLAARTDGTPVLLVSSPNRAGCPSAGSVLALELTGSLPEVVWGPGAEDPNTGGSLSLALKEHGSQGYEVPDGWLLVAPNQELALTNHTGSLVPQLISLSGGGSVSLSVQPTFAH